MKGGLNKLMRNINATVHGGSSAYQQSLVKATYDGDMKEPKEKHLLFIQECLTDHNHKDLIS